LLKNTGGREIRELFSVKILFLTKVQPSLLVEKSGRLRDTEVKPWAIALVKTSRSFRAIVLTAGEQAIYDITIWPNS
jgi:hypothetical protein